MEGIITVILVFAFGAFIFLAAEKGFNTFSKEGIKSRKIKGYRFGFFEYAVKEIFQQPKRIIHEEYTCVFEAPILNQVEKIGHYKITAALSTRSEKNPYCIVLEVKMGSYSNNLTSPSAEYLSKEFCENELARLKKIMIDSDKYKETYKSLLIK